MTHFGSSSQHFLPPDPLSPTPTFSSLAGLWSRTVIPLTFVVLDPLLPQGPECWTAAFVAYRPVAAPRLELLWTVLCSLHSSNSHWM